MLGKDVLNAETDFRKKDELKSHKKLEQEEISFWVKIEMLL